MADPAPAPPATTAPDPRRAAWHVGILLVLTAVVFAPELLRILRFAIRDYDAAHALAAPILIGVLFVARRRALVDSLKRGSGWGVALIALGIVITLAASWPFNHGLPRLGSMLIVAAGSILAICGWPTLKRCLPLLLIAVLALPIGTRLNAILTRKPERVTLVATSAAMEMLPGVDVVEFRGPDLHFVAGEDRGTVALGEPRRYVTMHFACLSLIVFIVFIRIRPFWQVVVAAVAAPVLVFLCNLGRLMAWALLSVYGGTDPTSGGPRAAAALVALVLAWALAAALLAVLNRLIVEPAGNGDATPEPGESEAVHG